MKKYLILTGVLLLFFNVQAQQEITTIILVRHAEKGLEPKADPGLTEKGKERANNLAKVLEHVSIDAIYSTPFVRTKLTVEPLASQKSLEVTEYSPHDFEKEVMDIVKSSTGKTIVISGHSNTTPRLLNMLLGEDKYDDLNDSDYDNLYIVSYLAKEQAKVIALQYGEASVVE